MHPNTVLQSPHHGGRLGWAPRGCPLIWLAVSSWHTGHSIDQDERQPSIADSSASRQPAIVPPVADANELPRQSVALLGALT